MSADPKPTIALQILSAIIIAGCVFAFSIGLSALTITWDPCTAFLSGVFFLPLSAALGIQQYRGTFWRNRKAALFAAICLFIVGGLLWLTFLVNLGEILLSGGRAGLLLDSFWPMLVVGTLAAVAGWANEHWSRLLKVESASSLIRPGQFTLRDLLVGVAVISEMIASVTFLLREVRPQFAEHVASKDAPFSLPVNARDVSYCQGVRGSIAYEFTIDEEGFKDWINSGVGSIESISAKVTLDPITAPVTIDRFNSLSRELKGPESITVSNGLFYSWSKEGRGVHAVFDRNTNRAYFEAHFN
jgi:hypothetical protein